MARLPKGERCEQFLRAYFHAPRGQCRSCREMLLDLFANNDKLVKGDRPPVSDCGDLIQLSLSLFSFVCARSLHLDPILGEI